MTKKEAFMCTWVERGDPGPGSDRQAGDIPSRSGGQTPSSGRENLTVAHLLAFSENLLGR